MILTIIQARMSSQRLPGKVLMPLYKNISMLEYVVKASMSSQMSDKTIIATSENKEDKKIYSTFMDKGIHVFLGGLNNVLKRFYDAASIYKPSHIIRLTGDSPLLFYSPNIIDYTVKYHLVHNNDYTRNSKIISSFDSAEIDDPLAKNSRVGFPSGLDVEVFTMNTLLKTYKLAISAFEKEHVTPFMHNENMFKVGFCLDGNLYADKIKNNLLMYNFDPNIKLSIDTKEDYQRVKKIMEELTEIYL